MNNDRTIATSRILKSPRKMIWKAWTDPKLLALWWGPKGFTNTFREFDLRPQGYWRFTMHGPDGKKYENESTFIEIIPDTKFMFRHVCAPFFIFTMEMKEAAGGTELTWHMLFDSAETCTAVKNIVTTANEENLDRLEQVLNSIP